VAGEERLAVQLEVALVLVEHAIEPRQQLLGAVVGVQDDGDAVDRRDAADVVGGGDGTRDRGLLVAVGDALRSSAAAPDVFSPSRSGSRTYLSGKVGGTALGHLQDDGAVLVARGLEGGDGGGGRGHVLRASASDLYLIYASRSLLTIAGMAKLFSWAYSKRRSTSSPTMTPLLRESLSRIPMVTEGGAVDEISQNSAKDLKEEVSRSARKRLKERE